MRPHRPFLVGLVCWVLIISGSVGVFLTMKQLGTPAFTASFAVYPYSPTMAETILFGSLALFVICGICMYEGQSWARHVYLATLFPFLVQGRLWIPHAQAPGLAGNLWWGELVFAILSLIILFLPQARRYFHPPLYIDE